MQIQIKSINVHIKHENWNYVISVFWSVAWLLVPHGLVLIFWKQLIWDFHTQQGLEFIQNWVKTYTGTLVAL